MGDHPHPPRTCPDPENLCKVCVVLDPVLPLLFSWRPTYQGCVFSPTFPYGSNYKLQCSTFCAAPVCRSRVTRRVLSGAKDHGDFLKKGGGVKTFTSTPPPWTLFAWRHPPSGKLKNAPTLEHSQAPPPLGHCPCDVIHIRASHYIRSVVTLRHLLSAARVGKDLDMVAWELFCLALIGRKHWIYLGLPTNPHNMVIFPVDLGFPYNLLNIPTNPHNMVIFPVGFPYNLQRAKFPYCRGIPLRVATLA